MAWVKGQSGNPGGRPKLVGQVQEEARKHTELAIATIAEIARDTAQPARARVAAAEVILDRGWGKAPQTIEMQGITALPDHVIDAILTAFDALDAGQPVATGSARGTPSLNGIAPKTAH